jgi:hypothetical protein
MRWYICCLVGRVVNVKLVVVVKKWRSSKCCRLKGPLERADVGCGVDWDESGGPGKVFLWTSGGGLGEMKGC